MAEKYITPDGKKMLLRLGFVPDDSTSTFNYVALGVGTSKAYDGESSFKIAIMNQSIADNTLDQAFAYAKVPEIDKSNNVSLKYTIILEIE